VRSTYVSLNSHTSSESEVQLLLEAAEKHCRHDQSSRNFRESLLWQLLQHTSANAVRLWDIRQDQPPSCCAAAGDPVSEPPPDELTNAAPGVIDVTRVAGGPQELLLRRILTLSVVVDGVQLVLEVVLADVDAARDLMVPLCDVLADIQRRLLLGAMVDGERQLRQTCDLISLMHADLSSEHVANTLASDAAAVFNCQRVSVCQKDLRGHWKVVAATAVSEPDIRADAVRGICRLVEVAEQKAHTQTEAEESVSTAVGDADGTTGLTEGTDAITLPLTLSTGWQNCHWAIVMESDDLSLLDRPTLGWVCRHAAVAFRNCERLAATSFLARARRLPTLLLSRRPLIVLFAVTVAAVWLLALPTDFRIEVPGQVVPSSRIHVFTPDSGIMSWIGVEEGSAVQAGQELCHLRNDEIELELETVKGDLAASEARLSALQSMKGTYPAGRNALLSGEELELTAKIESLLRQKTILETRRRNLVVRSTIDGRIYGDMVREHLQGRPVQRGQFLFDIANPQSEWKLELRVPESEIRHVLNAVSQSGVAPRITFTMETHPAVTLETELRSVGDAAEIDDKGRLSTRVTAVLAQSPFQTERPGAGVIAWIHCGRRARGYVYFRSVIEFLERGLFQSF
jgi:HlyD family secretion protein